MVQTIPQMHQQLQQLNQFYNTTTHSFIKIINSHPGQLTPKDLNNFKDLIQQIRNDVLNRIHQFFNNKYASKSELYDSQITNYTQTSQDVRSRLTQFRRELEEATVELKKEQNRRERLLDSFSQKYSEHTVLKRAWKLVEENREERKVARELDAKMDSLYRKNLIKKAFFPWRTLTYKQGYENTVRNQTEKDIASIHQQYQSIISILKTKINQTDEMMKLKRAAKGEFAFALSKNLLRTISNLSMEVMSLNQMGLRDGECEEGQTKKFMKTVQNVISQKLGQVREYKRSILGEDKDEGEDKSKRRKKITFV